jgi:hypothetical protein
MRVLAVMAGVMVAAGASLAAPAGVLARPVVVVRAPVLRVSPGPVVVERAGYGRLHVEVDPERARVYVDGRYVGRGDTTRTLRAGRHVVRVVLSNGREAAETVHVDAGRITRARLDL